jgi:Fe-S-cluster containining protein
MTGSCNGCGDCCSVVVLKREYKTAGRVARSRGEELSADYLWALDDLVEISYADARQTLPSLSADLSDELTYNRCRHFDYVERRCTAYERRPPVCRDFPWYAATPNSDRIEDLPLCGFWPDVSAWRASADGLAELVA